MAKYSVKKPLTVLVAVIAILVLGVVSFLNMTPDLLPSMDFPYVVLITSYAGASPEKVELAVTKPLEQAMATLENIESISSTSSDNVSVVFLEFNDEVNLESTTVDILQKVSQIEGYWEDTVGTPLILKINPDMLPVMVAAVEVEGMDTAELSRFVDETLQNKLEGISGVASLSVSGLVEEQVNVVLQQDRIDALNERMAASINSQFDDAEQELLDAQQEIKDGLGQLNSAINEIEGGLTQLKAGDAALNAKEIELMEGKLALNTQLAELNENLLALNETESQLEPLHTALGLLVEAERAASSQYQGVLALQEQLDAVNTGWTTLVDGLVAAGRDDIRDAADDAARRAILEAEQNPDYLAWKTDADILDAQLAAAGLTADTLPVALVTAETAATLAQTALAEFEALLVEMGTNREELETGWAALQSGKEQLVSAIAMLESLLGQLERGEIELARAMAQLENVKLTTQTTISMKMPQLTVTQSQLNAALAEVESGLEQLETARENALKQADLSNMVTMNLISQILKAQNFSMPAGYVHQDGVDYLVRVGDVVSSPEELSALVLMNTGIEDIGTITLGDVADVFVSSNLDNLYAKINGNDGVVISFNKQSTYATATVTDNLATKFEELSEQYEGLHFTPLMDQGDYINIVVDSILQNLAMGAILAVIILFLFLKDLKPTLITLCSIPISVIFAITLMYFSGVTLNIISLSGLAVAVGMLVDNSVVVIENIFRLRNKGFSAIKAAVSGTAQVAGAITSSTLTTICVFAPIVFVQGITRQLFTDMALTLAYALLASLIVAMTLVPAMAGRMFNKMEEKPNKLLNRMLKVYEKSLDWALRHKVIMLVSVVALLGASVFFVLIRGFAFMPAMDMPQLTVTVSMPEESTFEELKETSDEVAARILAIDGVETVGSLASSGGMLDMIGIGGLGGGSSDEAATSTTMYVMVDERASGNTVSEAILAATADVEAEVTVDSSSMMDISALGGSGVTVNIYGDNTEDLFAAARTVAAELEGLSGVAEVNNGIGETDPEIRFVVDKEKAMEHNLTVAQVYSEVAGALATSSTATSINWEGNDYNVIVVQAEEDTLTPQYIKTLSFTVTDRAGNDTVVFVDEIADIVTTESATSIRRSEQRRYITVSATVAEGSNVSLVSQAAERALRGTELPSGTSYEMAGENQTIMDSFRDLGYMMLLGILLVYLIMVAQFQSLKSPFIVMFTIPLAFTGGFLALLFTGMELSVVALIGFIMLVGIIVNNGIVLVDYINQLRMEGVERVAAIKEAGVTRMRPILMTSITTILGLSTMALGMGTGAELMQPVAIVCIGGLAYATLMTLYIIPIIYAILNKKDLKVISEEELEVDNEA